MNTAELWKKHPNDIFDKRYLVSNKGNVKNIISKINLKPTLKNGYYYCTLFDGIKKKPHFRIHRLVAKLFVPNKDPLKYTEVNHINGNKLDNDASNLEWCTKAENSQHAYKTGLTKRNTQAIVSSDSKTFEHRIHNSIIDAATALNVSATSISKVINGLRKSVVSEDKKHKYFIMCYDKNNDEAFDRFTYTTKNNENRNIKSTKVATDFTKFKQIVDYPNYIINNKGDIYNINSKKKLTHSQHSDGRLQIKLTNNEKDKTYLIHRLVAMYFVKRTDKNFNSVSHIDTNKSNNYYKNLKWTTIAGIATSNDCDRINTPYFNLDTYIKAPVVKLKKINSLEDLLAAKTKNLSKRQKAIKKQLLDMPLDEAKKAFSKLSF